MSEDKVAKYKNDYIGFLHGFMADRKTIQDGTPQSL